MGILDDDDLMEIAQLVEEANKFKPQELNEANVQAIFHRCVSKDYSSETLWSDIWLPTERTDLRTIFFVKDIVLKNKKIHTVFIWPVSCRP